MEQGMADVKKMLASLYEERARIEDAILNLEALADGRGKRRGRPPKWLAEARERQAKTAPAAKATPSAKAKKKKA